MNLALVRKALGQPQKCELCKWLELVGPVPSILVCQKDHLLEPDNCQDWEDHMAPKEPRTTAYKDKT